MNPQSYEKYVRQIHGIDKDGNEVFINVDIYSVLRAFPTGDPALDHAAKKLLVPGGRGYKEKRQDLMEVVSSVNDFLYFDSPFQEGSS